MDVNRRAVAVGACALAVLVAGCIAGQTDDRTDTTTITAASVVAFESNGTQCTTSVTNDISSELSRANGGAVVTYSRNVSLPGANDTLGQPYVDALNKSAYAFNVPVERSEKPTEDEAYWPIRCTDEAYARYNATIHVPSEDESWQLVVRHDGTKVGSIRSNENGSSASASTGASDRTGGDRPTPAASVGDAESVSGVNVTALAHRHHAALLDAGSFTVNHSERVVVADDATPDEPTPEGYTPPSYTRQHVDFPSERYRSTSVTVGSRRSMQYVDPNVSARRSRGCPGCVWNYSYLERSGPASTAERVGRLRSTQHAADLANLLRGATVDFDYSGVGSGEQDGTVMQHYRARTTLESAPPPFDAPPTGVATIAVTDNGFIQRFTLRYNGTANVTSNGSTQTVNVSHVISRSYTDIGSTGIESPDWLDDARSADPPREVRQGER